MKFEINEFCAYWVVNGNPGEIKWEINVKKTTTVYFGISDKVLTNIWNNIIISNIQNVYNENYSLKQHVT